MTTKIKLMMLIVALLSSGYSYSQQNVTVTVKKDDGMLHYQSEEDNNTTVTVKRDNGMLNYEPSKNVRGLTPYNPTPVKVKTYQELQQEQQDYEMRKLQIERMRLENERLKRENNAANSGNNSSSQDENVILNFPVSSVIIPSINPNTANEKDWYNQGEAYTLQGNHTQAIACYQKALNINPNLLLANKNIGYEYYLMREYDNAIPFLERAIRIEPKEGQTYSILGGIYLAKNNYYKTIEYCQKAIDRSKIGDYIFDEISGTSSPYSYIFSGFSFNLSDPLYNIGLAYYKLNNKEKAIPYLKEASLYYNEVGEKAKALLQQIKY